MCVKINGLIFFMLIPMQMCLGKLPSSIVPCHLSNPSLDKCIISAVNNIKPLLAHGNLGEDYRTPALEPLQLDNIDLGRGDQFNVVFSDLLVRGGSNFMIDKLSSNASNLSFDVTLKLPRIDFVGNYSMKINLLLLKLQGKGKVKGYAENAKAFAKIRGARVPRDGVEYVRFHKLHLKIMIDVFKMHLENLFNGDPVLGEVGNRILNENHDLYLNEITPGLEKELSKKFLDIANMVMEKTTYDEMFPL